MITRRQSPKQTSRKVRTRTGAQPRPQILAVPESPRCSVCQRPLSRLPFYLAMAPGSSGSFQCQKCFYPGTGHSPERSAVVASERTRFLTSYFEGGGSRSRSAPQPASSNDD